MLELDLPSFGAGANRALAKAPHLPFEVTNAIRLLGSPRCWQSERVADEAVEVPSVSRSIAPLADLELGFRRARPVMNSR